jgi:hypothetical protein
MLHDDSPGDDQAIIIPIAKAMPDDTNRPHSN